MGNRIIIIGAGGHGKVVCDAIIAENKYSIAGFADASVAVGTTVQAGFKVIAAQSELEKLKNEAEFFVIAIGNNLVREKVFNEALKSFQAATIIHPSAAIGSDVKISEGVVVLSNATINASSVIGKNTIVNAGTVVDHDCKIGEHVHLSIGTMVGSNSTVKDHVVTAIGQSINAFSKL